MSIVTKLFVEIKAKSFCDSISVDDEHVRDNAIIALCCAVLYVGGLILVV